MGADWYIKKISNKASKQYGHMFTRYVNKRNNAKDKLSADLFDIKVQHYYSLMYPKNGYFRDSYNKWNLLSHLGLCYTKDIEPLIDNEANISVDNIKKIRELIESHAVPDPNEPLKEPNSGVKTTKTIMSMLTKIGFDTQQQTAELTTQEREDEYRYFCEKKRQLLTLLDTAIKLNEPIYLSY